MDAQTDGDAADGVLPADPAGAALDAPADAPLSFDLAALERLFDLGGPVVALLAVLSIAALAIGIAKLLQFRRARIWSGHEVAAAVALYRAGDRAEARRMLARVDTPLARSVAVAMQAAGGADREAARDAADTVSLAEIEGLRGGLRPLEFIAGVSPLLGLFGTVLGMIAAFQALEAAGDRVDPAILAGGIWEALFTTAAGLAVAIPALALSNWFERMVDSFAHKVEHQTGLVLTADVAGASSAVPLAAE